MKKVFAFLFVLAAVTIWAVDNMTVNAPADTPRNISTAINHNATNTVTKAELSGVTTNVTIYGTDSNGVGVVSYTLVITNGLVKVFP